MRRYIQTGMRKAKRRQTPPDGTGHRKRRRSTPGGGSAYFIRDRGRGVIYCECARFHFPDKLARREIVYTYCAHPSGYRQCVLKQAMDGFYRRKYDRLDAVSGGGEA